MWRYSVIREPVTAAKFINKSSLFILLSGVIHLVELKPNSEQKAEYIFVKMCNVLALALDYLVCLKFIIPIQK